MHVRTLDPSGKQPVKHSNIQHNNQQSSLWRPTAKQTLSSSSPPSATINSASRIPTIRRPPLSRIQATANSPSRPFYHAERHRQRLLASTARFSWPAASCLRDRAAWTALLRRAVAADAADHPLARESPGFATAPRRVRVELRRLPAFNDPHWQRRDDAAGGKPDVEDVDEKTRMVTAVRVAGTPAVDLSALFPPTLDLDGTFKGILCSVVLDWVPTPASVWNSVKTGRRSAYERARRRMAEAMSLPGPVGAGESQPAGSMTDEVVLVGDDGQVREGSVSNVYFRRGGRWVTPPVGGVRGRGAEAEAGSESEWGLPGTVRAWALERGLAVEGAVARADVVVGEDVWVSNALRGFVRARIAWVGDAERVWPGVDG
jgi:branched-subunit amino acid aminotransferase/4-amino-4-deoxychorismate lyase